MRGNKFNSLEATSLSVEILKFITELDPYNNKFLEQNAGLANKE